MKLIPDSFFPLFPSKNSSGAPDTTPFVFPVCQFTIIYIYIYLYIIQYTNHY